jgi:hypothetical protein
MRLAETVADLFRGHAVVVDQLAKRLYLVGMFSRTMFSDSESSVAL